MSVLVASTVKYWRIKLICWSSMYAAVQAFVTCWCTVKLLSSVTPRFLTRKINVSISYMHWLRNKSWGRHSFRHNKHCLSFHQSVATYSVIQNITSETHFWIVEMVVSSWSRELEFCIWVSSANEWWHTEWQSKMLSSGFVYIIQIEWVQELSPEVHHSGGKMAQISSHLQQQSDPIGQIWPNPRQSCARNAKRML